MRSCICLFDSESVRMYTDSWKGSAENQSFCGLCWTENREALRQICSWHLKTSCCFIKREHPVHFAFTDTFFHYILCFQFHVLVEICMNIKQYEIKDFAFHSFLRLILISNASECVSNTANQSFSFFMSAALLNYCVISYSEIIFPHIVLCLGSCVSVVCFHPWLHHLQRSQDAPSEESISYLTW